MLSPSPLRTFWPSLYSLEMPNFSVPFNLCYLVSVEMGVLLNSTAAPSVKCSLVLKLSLPLAERNSHESSHSNGTPYVLRQTRAGLPGKEDGRTTSLTKGNLLFIFIYYSLIYYIQTAILRALPFILPFPTWFLIFFPYVTIHRPKEEKIIVSLLIHTG